MIEDVARSLEEAACALRAACERCESGSVRSVKRKHERFRVSVTRPRKGRDWDEWVLRVRGPGLPSGGRRERTHLAYGPASRAKADRLARERERELNGDGPTVLEVYDRWISADSELIATNTMKTRQTARRALAGSAFGSIQAAEISAAEVQAFRDHVSASVALPTARLYLRRVRQAWVWAGVRGIVSDRWPDMPPMRGGGTKKRAYTGAELRGLLSFLREVCGGRYLPLAAFLVETGCRVGAAVQTPRDALSVLEDGSGEIVLEARTRKIQSDHVVRVSPGLVSLLTSTPEGAWLFPSGSNSTRHQSSKALHRYVRRWVSAQGLSGVLDTHSFRRSACGALANLGVPVERARRVTGQSAGTFLSYAAKAEIDVSDEARLLWLDPALLVQPDPGGPSGSLRANITPSEGSQPSNQEGSDSGLESRAALLDPEATPQGVHLDPRGPKLRSPTALILPPGYARRVARVLRDALGGDRS